jgi:hypothetical protein
VVLRPPTRPQPCPRCAELENRITELEHQLAAARAQARLDGALVLARKGGGGTRQREVLDGLRADVVRAGAEAAS